MTSPNQPFLSISFLVKFKKYLKYLAKIFLEKFLIKNKIQKKKLKFQKFVKANKKRQFKQGYFFSSHLYKSSFFRLKNLIDWFYFQN